MRSYAFATEYCSLLWASPGMLNITWFSDESQFDLDNHAKQNVRFGVSENPGLTVTSPVQPERVAVWCVLSSARIFGLLFIDGTVASEVYLRVLSDEFVIFLLGYDD
jgi:hypothetical protein